MKEIKRMYRKLDPFWHSRIVTLANEVREGIDIENPTLSSNTRHWANRADFMFAVRFARVLIESGYFEDKDDLSNLLNYAAGVINHLPDIGSGRIEPATSNENTDEFEDSVVLKKIPFSNFKQNEIITGPPAGEGGEGLVVSSDGSGFYSFASEETLDRWSKQGYVPTTIDPEKMNPVQAVRLKHMGISLAPKTSWLDVERGMLYRIEGYDFVVRDVNPEEGVPSFIGDQNPLPLKETPVEKPKTEIPPVPPTEPHKVKRNSPKTKESKEKEDQEYLRIVGYAGVAFILILIFLYLAY